MARKNIESAVESETDLNEQWRQVMARLETYRLMKIVDEDDSVLDVLVDLDLPAEEETLLPLSLGAFKAVAEKILEGRGVK